MWEVGAGKLTKVMMLFLWVQVMEWSLVGNYVGENGDLEVSFHLGTKYTIQEGYYNWKKKRCVFTKWYLQAKLGRTWAYFPIFSLSQHSLSTSHHLQYLPWVEISQILQPWLLSKTKTQHRCSVVRASQGPWIPKPLSSKELY